MSSRCYVLARVNFFFFVKLITSKNFADNLSNADERLGMFFLLNLFELIICF
jgi:hypothetical protein